jgi:hypothetical protein
VLRFLDEHRDPAAPAQTTPLSWTDTGDGAMAARRTVGQWILPRLETLHAIGRVAGKVRIPGAPGGFEPARYRLLLNRKEVRAIVDSHTPMRRLKSQPYAVNTVRNMVSALRLVFHWAMHEDDLTGVTRNPAANPRLFFPSRASLQQAVLPSQVWKRARGRGDPRRRGRPHVR